MASAAPDARRERIVEAVFRALTDVNAEGSAIRRPLAFHELCAVAGATPEELRPILDAFRAPGVSFLTPYAPKPIDDKTPIDISHEALIRCWRRISDKENGWLQTEIRDGLGWRLLVFQAETFAGDRIEHPVRAGDGVGREVAQAAQRGLGRAVRRRVAEGQGAGSTAAGSIWTGRRRKRRRTVKGRSTIERLRREAAEQSELTGKEVRTPGEATRAVRLWLRRRGDPSPPHC